MSANYTKPPYFKDDEEELKDFNENQDTSAAYLRNTQYQKIQHHIRKKKISKGIFYTFLVLGSIFFIGINVQKLDYFSPNQVYTTQNQTKIITLPDGSKITLFKESKIEIVKKEFNVHDRIVKLQGSAIFKVAKNPKKPFIVNSAYTKVTALGTEFKVSEVNKKQTMVFLFEGKISIQSHNVLKTAIKPTQNQPKLIKLVLQPKQGVILNENTSILSSYQSTSKEIQLLKTKKEELKIASLQSPTRIHTQLQFTHTPLSQVITAIGNHYHADILYPNEITDQIEFTGVILTKFDLLKSLETIAQMNDLKVYQTDNYYIIEKKSH